MVSQRTFGQNKWSSYTLDLFCFWGSEFTGDGIVPRSGC